MLDPPPWQMRWKTSAVNFHLAALGLAENAGRQPRTTSRFSTVVTPVTPAASDVARSREIGSGAEPRNSTRPLLVSTLIFSALSLLSLANSALTLAVMASALAYKADQQSGHGPDHEDQ